MTMTRSFRLAMAIGVGLLAASFTANLAKANDAYVGKFTLPFQAHWGGLALAAGEYSFRVNTLTSNSSRVAVLRDGRNLGFVDVKSVNDYGTAGKTELVAVPSDEGYTISTLRLQTDKEDGCVIGFLAPEGKRWSPAQGQELAMRLPISVKGK